MPERGPGETARLKKLNGTKSSVGEGANGTHPACSWKHGQIYGSAQRGVRQNAGLGLDTVAAQLGGHNVTLILWPKSGTFLTQILWFLSAHNSISQKPKLLKYNSILQQMTVSTDCIPQ